MKIVVLTGGVGGARFLLGVKAHLGWEPTGPAPQDSADQVVAVVNTADDIRLHGLQVCPDLDSCMYTLSGAADAERGWGRAGETFVVAGELAAYGAEAPWFGLGDKDLATHLVRTRMLDAGYPLSSVTAALTSRWAPGVTLLPMTDDRVETHVVVDDPEPAGPDGEPGRIALHFQEWWIRYRTSLPAHAITPVGASESRPAPGVVEAIGGADLILLAPSNPVVSIGTILAVPGIADALRAATAPVVGVSPLIGGAPVRGHADACLAAIGVDSTATAIAAHYGARSTGGLLDGWLVAPGDEPGAGSTGSPAGITVVAAPLLMTDPGATAAMVATCRELAGV